MRTAVLASLGGTTATFRTLLAAASRLAAVITIRAGEGAGFLADWLGDGRAARRLVRRR